MAVEQAGFFPVHEGWKIFKPVGLPGSSSITVPAKTAVVEAFNQNIRKIIDRELIVRVAELERKIKSSSREPQWSNALGVLYARYGLFEKAQTYFDQTLQLDSEYYPALLNLGNISFLQEEYETAFGYYTRAAQKSPKSPAVLLAVARVNHRLENYYGAENAYRQLRERDPELAERFAYLALRGAEAGRAASAAGVKGAVLWAETK